MDFEVRRYRSVFISDVHLGTRGCQAELLLDFIRYVECDTLYLVGDIIDGWKLKSGWYWPQAHNDVVQKILRMARKGVKVIYVPGNHDEVVRDFIGVHFGGVVVATFTGGSGTTPLNITFNSSATQAAIQAVLDSLTFKNSTTTPGTTPRILQIKATDGNGLSITANETINITT